MQKSNSPERPLSKENEIEGARLFRANKSPRERSIKSEDESPPLLGSSPPKERRGSLLTRPNLFRKQSMDATPVPGLGRPAVEA